MPVHSSAVGKMLAPKRHQITTRRMLAYAAAVEERSPLFLDDTNDELSALPQFCVSLEWPVLSDPSGRELLGALPDELRRGVHAVQDSRFLKRIRPGAELEVTAVLVGLRRSRAGAILTTDLLTTELPSGEAVVRTRSVSIYRGVEVEGEEVEPPPDDEGWPAIERPLIEFDQREQVISATLPHAYTECADIWNPIHTERRVALAAGLPDIILHGTATWALAGCELQRRHGGGRADSLKRLCGSFRAMVLPATSIRIRHHRVGNGRVAFEVLNEAGEPAVADGWALFD